MKGVCSGIGAQVSMCTCACVREFDCKDTAVFVPAQVQECICLNKDVDVYLCVLFASALSGCMRLLLSRSGTRSPNGLPSCLLPQAPHPVILATQGS